MADSEKKPNKGGDQSKGKVIAEADHYKVREGQMMPPFLAARLAAKKQDKD